jgi:hypothetical protein
MANAKISDNSVFIPKSDILDVVGLAGYDSSGNVKISGANLKASVLNGTITTITGTAPISVTSGSTPVVSISQATTSSNGYLSSTDWNTFNNKTSNSGTVTTVSASISGSAYTATVTNATTTPSISIAPQGSSSQYINGAGNLTTFPTLPTVNNNTITLSPGTGLSGGGNFTLNQPSDKTITFTNTITNNNQLTNGAGYITSSSLPTVGNGTLTITVDGTPTTFSANQSNNTNLSFTTGSGTSIAVKDEGTQITSGVTSFNFVGAGVTATNSSNDVTVTIPGGSSGSGTVTSVSALTLGTVGTDLTSTVVNSNTTPVITLNVPSASASNRGALTSTDWTTFNNKTDNTGTVTQIIASSPLTGGTITSSGTIGIPQANTSDSGYLTSTDWNTFNNKTAFAEPAIFSGGGSPSLATGVTGLEIRNLIGAGVGDGIVTSLTTSGTSGVATLSSGVLNIPNYATGSGTVTEVTVSAPLTVSNGTTTPALNITQSDTNTDGYLSSTDWNTFNNKGSGTVTGSGTALTLPIFSTTTALGDSAISQTSDADPVVTIDSSDIRIKNKITHTQSPTDTFIGFTADDKFEVTTDNTQAIVCGTAGEVELKQSGVTVAKTINHALQLTGNGSSFQGRLRINCQQNNHYVDIIGPDHASNTAVSYTMQLPNKIAIQSAYSTGGRILEINASGEGQWIATPSDTNDNYYVTGASYSAGTLTLTRNGGLASLTATGFLQIGTSSTTALAGDTTTITTAQANEITANTAKVGITTAQANEITANTAKVGITTAQANEITANTAKVGITTQQASDITANNAKVSANNTTVTIAAGTGLTGGGSFTTNQSGASTITLNASGSSGGGFPSAVTAQTSATLSPAAVDTLYTVTTSSTTADIVITLPTAASNSGKIIGVKYAAQNSVDDTVVIKTISSQTIDGTNRTTNGLPLASVGTYYEVISDGSNWWIK